MDNFDIDEDALLDKIFQKKANFEKTAQTEDLKEYDTDFGAGKIISEIENAKRKEPVRHEQHRSEKEIATVKHKKETKAQPRRKKEISDAEREKAAERRRLRNEYLEKQAKNERIWKIVKNVVLTVIAIVPIIPSLILIIKRPDLPISQILALLFFIGSVLGTIIILLGLTDENYRNDIKVGNFEFKLMLISGAWLIIGIIGLISVY